MLSRRSDSTESSSEESEKEEQRERRSLRKRNTTRQNEELMDPLPTVQQAGKAPPTVQQTENIHSWSYKVSTKVVNNFFEWGSDQQDLKIDDLQTSMWSVDWWLGFRILPIIEHSVKEEEKIIGQRQLPARMSWGARFWSTLWIMWIAMHTVHDVPPLKLREMTQ